MKARNLRAPLAVAAGAMLVIAPAALFAGVQSAYTPERIVKYLADNVGMSLGPPGGEIRSLVLAPTQPTRLYAGTATGHIYVSHDGANSWQGLPLQLGHETVVDNLLVHPGNADIVFAAYWAPDGSGGLSRTLDGGATWDKLAVPGDPSLRAIAAAPSSVRTMYIGGIGGIWRSDDGGDSFSLPLAGGFDHHPDQGLGAGRPDQDAAAARQRATWPGRAPRPPRSRPPIGWTSMSWV